MSADNEQIFSFDAFVKRLSEARPFYRKNLTDMEWSNAQPRGKKKYKFNVGDRVFFALGGSGIIRKVEPPCCGHPVSYATEKITGVKYHPRRKDAWHYEWDFLRPSRRFQRNINDANHKTRMRTRRSGQ